VTWRWIAALVVGWLVTLAAAVALQSRELLAVAPAWLVPIPVLLARRARRPFDVFDPIWLITLIYLFAYGVVPAVQLWDAAPFESVSNALGLSSPHYYAAALLSGLGLLALYAGFFVALGGRLARVAARRVPDGSNRALLLTALGLLAIGLLAVETSLFLVGFWRYSPADVVSGGLRAATLKAAGGRGYLSIGYLALGLGCASLGLWFVRWAGDDPRRRRWVVPAFGVIAVFAIGVFVGLLGSRNLAVVTLVQLAVVLHLGFRRVPARLAAGAFAALAVLSVVFISLRNTGTLSPNPVVWAGYVGKTFDGFNFLSNALSRVHDFVYGKTLVEDWFWTYMPRALIPGKPDVYGIVAAQEMIIPGTNASLGGSATFPPGILAEGYVNFGVAGVLLIPFAAALLARALYDWAAASGGAMAMLLFGYVLGDETGLFRGFGTILPGMAVVTVLLLPMVLRLPRLSLSAARLRPMAILGAGATTVAALGIAVVVNPAVPVGGSERSGPRPGQPVPLTARGELFPPKAKRDVTLVVFWSSWCTTCQSQLHDLSEVAKAHGARVVGVPYQDRPDQIAATMRAAGVRWRNHPDGDGLVTVRAYHASTLPSVFVVNRDLRVSCVFAGPMVQATLDDAVARTASPAYKCPA
jgi:thiol-disulfide isomerase/thioredoxin